jgi:acyl-CoA reductase-like NAD-dependent aldehyde dehydrogenase
MWYNFPHKEMLMAKVTIRFPETTPQQRRAIFYDLAEHIDENENLEALVATLRQFEEQYGMSTVEFYARFVAGKMGDARDFIRWAGAFQSYAHLLRFHVQKKAEVA